MIHYLLIKQDGSIAQRGVVEKEEWIVSLIDTKIEIIEEDDPRQPEAIKHTYADFRRMEYPPVLDQLGAIWKVLADNNLLSGEGLVIYKQIQAVKDSRPKE